ncbi:MAG: hypothetical protein ACKVLF_02495 [Nitrospinaceae bacterium]
MRITSSHFKIKKNEVTLLSWLVFFMHSKDMLHINNEVGSKHLENILSTAIVGIGLTGFTSL